MKNKLIAWATVLFLAVDTVMFAAAGYPVEAPAQQEETIAIEEEEAKPTLPSEPIEQIIYEEIAVEALPPETIEVVSAEYPVAAQVWNAMKAKGWTDEVCAGIMGNMMAECGGRTLNLNPNAIGDGGTSYGLCQWHNGRKNNLINNYGTEIEQQIEYLSYELGDVNSYFSTITNYEQIAYEFCIKFERPSNAQQKGIDRKTLAQTAYNYFVGK